MAQYLVEESIKATRRLIPMIPPFFEKAAQALPQPGLSPLAKPDQ
jgi:hypothetical protein